MFNKVNLIFMRDEKCGTQCCNVNSCVCEQIRFLSTNLLDIFNTIPLFKLELCIYKRAVALFPAPLRILSIFQRHLKLLSDFLIQSYDVIIETKSIHCIFHILKCTMYSLKCSITIIEKMYFL